MIFIFLFLSQLGPSAYGFAVNANGYVLFHPTLLSEVNVIYHDAVKVSQTIATACRNLFSFFCLMPYRGLEFAEVGVLQRLGIEDENNRTPSRLD